MAADAPLPKWRRRKPSVKTDPINQGARYPKGFKALVRQHCMKLQAEYGQMIGHGVVPTSR